jgi:cation transport ATPase
MRRRHGQARIQQRLSRRHERFLYVTGTLLLSSGVGWLIGHYLLRASGAFGAGPHPSEAWWMRLHGAAVIGFLVVFGALLPGHIVQNWRQRINRYSGLAVVIVVSLLAVSGYGLYYLVDDTQRAVTSALHWVVGLAASGALVLHVVLGKRLAARAREQRMAARLHRLKPATPRTRHPEVSAGDIKSGPS